TNAALAKEFDVIQARIDVDHELAVRLTHEEQEKYTIEERVRLLAEFFDQRKKQLATARAEAIRNKPPTKTQVRNMMITYLKHMEVIKDSEKKVDSSSKPAGGSRKKTLARKRAGEKKSEESAKKQKLEDVAEEQESAKSDEEAAADYEHEKEELRMWLTVVSDEEETVDPKILSAKYPIVDWESQNLGSVDMEDLHVYKIIRADGNTSYHKSLSSMLRKFDRQDLVDLHRLVMKRFEDTTPEGYNLLLWGDLKVMFEPNAEDEIWSNQQDWTLISWKLYESCGVHTLLMDGTLTCFNMLVEKRYPLIKEMLQKMLNWKLEAEAESTMAFELLKFINLKKIRFIGTLGEKGIDCNFVGYAEHSKAYRFYVIEPNESVSINSIIESRDAIFDENRLSSIPRQKDIIPNSVESQRDDHFGDVPNETPEPHRGKRARKDKSYGFDFQLYLVKGSRDQVGSQYSYCYSIEEDPRTYNEAMQSRDATFWKEAIDDEIGSIMENNTWVLSDLPPGCKPLGCKWIFKRKMKVDGTIDKFKARLVIQGFRQKEGIDYFDTYALVAHITTIRLLLALAAIHNLVIHQMDVKTTFLNGDLEEEVYMKQPKGFVMPGNEHKVCKLVKSLYGLKQAPKQWHQKFDEVVLSSGFLLNQSDKCVYSKFDSSGKGVIICLYVDDMLIFGTDQNQVDKTKKFLSSKFSMKDMGEADVILGIKIKRENKGIVITQSHYIEKILKKFNREDCSPITILKTNTPYPSRKIRRIRACTHQRPQRNKDQYAVSRENQYAVFKIWNQYNILEDIKRGPYSKKSPIRRISHLDELHVTWAHLEKKQTRLWTNTKTLKDLCSQSLETASYAILEVVTTHQVTASHISRRRQLAPT
ncbi:zinc finger, CCHC-type containing protein, partial [Tanacetum coccineum]